MKKIALGLLWTMVAVVAPMLSAAADEDLTGRLKRIQEKKTIILGYYETGIPFSYLDNNGVQGFSAEVSLRLVDAVKQHLGLDTLKVRWNPMTVSTRMTLVKANVIDIECTSTSHRVSREAHVSFSNTIFVSSDGFIARKDAGIETVEQLAGKRIAVVDGSDSVETIGKISGAQAVIVPNNPRGLQAVEAGEADAFFSNVGLLAREMVRTKDSSPFEIFPVNDNLSAYACMVPKGDTALKKLVDDKIADMMKSGEMEQIFRKWFNSPIPPYGRVAHLRLGDLNKQLYQQPNDKPLD